MINYSKSFGCSSRCKYCKSEPKYLAHDLFLNSTLNLIQKIKKNIKYLSRHYKIELVPVIKLGYPNHGIKLQYVSFNNKFAKIKIDDQRSRKIKDDSPFKSNFTYYCKCFKTSWASQDLINDQIQTKHKMSCKKYTSNNKIILI